MEEYDYEIRTLLGTASFIGTMICFIFTCYKYVVCQEKNNRVTVHTLEV